MYYRGDFEDLNVVPDTPYYYANTPDSAIRAQELAAGQDVASSGFFGGGGFLKELGETLGAMAMFYAPFAPVLLPALAATPVVGTAIKAGETLSQGGGALRDIIAATTTGTGATTTGTGATSGPASPGESETSQALQKISSLLQQRLSEISFQTAGPSAVPRKLDLVSQARQAQVRPPSRATRGSPRLSAKQRKALLQAALAQALQ